MKPKIRQPKFWLITLASLIAGFGVPDASTQVVLSEIMFDASGNESHDEFIEIVNLSISEEINLSGWQISDGSSTDNLRQVDDGLTLLPGQFGIILDLSYLENSSLYDPLIPPGSLILTIDNSTFGSRGLSNSTAETVTLLNGEGQRVGFETVHRRKDGSLYDVEVHLQLANLDNKRVFVAFVRDITERKQLEQEAHEHRERLAHVTRVSTLGEMAVGLAHEINQPLAAIAN